MNVSLSLIDWCWYAHFSDIQQIQNDFASNFLSNFILGQIFGQRTQHRWHQSPLCRPLRCLCLSHPYWQGKLNSYLSQNCFDPYLRKCFCPSSSLPYLLLLCLWRGFITPWCSEQSYTFECQIRALCSIFLEMLSIQMLCRSLILFFFFFCN